jgi:hypothetical protein
MGNKAFILATVCIEIVVVVFFEFVVFRTPVQQTTDPYITVYYNEFNKTLTPYNYSFSPPVSMYRALIIALESGGWNATSLKDMTIFVEFDYCAFVKNAKEAAFRNIYNVTQPVADWLPQRINDTTYRYIWIVEIRDASGFLSIPPTGLYCVDAGTAELVPTGW